MKMTMKKKSKLSLRSELIAAPRKINGQEKKKRMQGNKLKSFLLSTHGLVQIATSAIPRIQCRNTDASVEDSMILHTRQWCCHTHAESIVIGRSKTIVPIRDVMSYVIQEAVLLATLMYQSHVSVEKKRKEFLARYPLEANFSVRMNVVDFLIA